MGLITETQLRKEFIKNGIPTSYVISECQKLTPAARDFLKDRNVSVVYNLSASKEDLEFAKPVNKDEWETSKIYTNYYTSEVMDSKPESMTHLFENYLVYKDDSRIILRGRLDTLQSLIIDIQIYFQSLNRNDLLLILDELLEYSRKILGHEVFNTAISEQKLMGLTSDEIRDRSHNPEKHFGLKQMVLVNYRQGPIVAKLNYLRAYARECELVAVQAFRKGDIISQNSLIQALNRLSSCFHILMYKELSK